MISPLKPLQRAAGTFLTGALLQDEDGNHKLPPEEVATIKQELIGLMILSPPNIQTQLGEAISVIADSDFWKRWDTLIQVRGILGRDPAASRGLNPIVIGPCQPNLAR
jgi:hypothetical protein